MIERGMSSCRRMCEVRGMMLRTARESVEPAFVSRDEATLQLLGGLEMNRPHSHPVRMHSPHTHFAWSRESW